MISEKGKNIWKGKVNMRILPARLLNTDPCDRKIKRVNPEFSSQGNKKFLFIYFVFIWDDRCSFTKIIV